jgi:hypothetical protein
MAAKKLSGKPCKCQQASEITSIYRLGMSSYTNVRSAMQHLVKQDKHENGSRTYANTDKYDDDTNATKEACFNRKL